MDRKQIKELAKQQIKGKVWMYLLVTIVAGAISGISSVISIIIAPMMLMGIVYINLDIRNGKEIDIARLFDPFKDFGRAWVTTFLVGLFTYLWSLLFVIPGIVKGLGYSLAPYIIAENPDITATDAIKLSSSMMKGHKGELFVLYLSFIGWFLLGAITFGLVYIYVNPYMNLSIVNFYDKVKAEYNGN